MTLRHPGHTISWQRPTKCCTFPQCEWGTIDSRSPIDLRIVGNENTSPTTSSTTRSPTGHILRPTVTLERRTQTSFSTRTWGNPNNKKYRNKMNRTIQYTRTKWRPTRHYRSTVICLHGGDCVAMMQVELSGVLECNHCNQEQQQTDVERLQQVAKTRWNNLIPVAFCCA